LTVSSADLSSTFNAAREIRQGTFWCRRAAGS
jgi:hypothetical protein